MEGPSLVILREQAQKFVGQRVMGCESALPALDCARIAGQRLTALNSFGKHFLMNFAGLHLRVHFLMFGSCWLDKQRPGKTAKLSLLFRRGAMHFYACSIRPLEQPPEAIYDWRVDLMAEAWDERDVLKLLARRPPETQLGDLLLDQEVFAGSGNIIKNEVPYLLGYQPETKLGALTAIEYKTLVRQMRAYCFQFYEWKKANVLKKNWHIYRKRMCNRCLSPVILKVTGNLQRISFFCPRCQKLRVRRPKSTNRKRRGS
jgi:endonuclease-8